MSKPLRLIGALAAFGSLWMPWYVVHIAALSSRLDTSNTQLPPAFADFARGLLAAIPQNISANGWTAMNGGDVAIAFLAGGLLLLSFAQADRVISQAAAAGLIGIAAIHIVSPPGPDGLLTPKAGPWVALIGGAVVLASTFLSDEDAPAPAPVAVQPLPAWSEPEGSVAPPR
jgi:hypothetical protein